MGYRASASKGGKSKTGKGQSAAAKHAYHLRAGYAVGRDGPREDLAASGHGHMPALATDDPAAFWLASDSFERANGTLFRELQLNLPSELTLAQQQEVLKSYCARLFDAERLPHSWAIHRHTNGGEPVLGENDHAHLMVSETMTDDFSRPAAQHFKRYNPKRPEAGGAKKTRSLKPKAWLMEARAAWAEEVNRGLVAAGHKPRFDHRSKNVRQGEALRLGDLREAARLDTPTQTHEGPRIAGMRRRVAAEKVALEDLPDYAQEVIEKNDRVRQLASEWLVQVEQMTDAELAEHFADELSPGGHVAAWMGAQHAQAHEDNRQRDVAAAIAAGELELLGLAQAEAAERATELAELIEQEQNDQQAALLSIERVQAHSAALIEHREQERRRADTELREVRAELQGAQEEAERLRAALAAPQPRCVTVALELRDRARGAAERAEQWRQDHPVRALLGKFIEPEPVRLARERQEAFSMSPERAEGIKWQEQRAEQRERLAGLQERLQGLQEAARTAEVRVMAREPLAALQERLQAAVGELERLEPRMTHDDRHSAQRRRTKLVEAFNWSPSKENLAVACIEARELLEPARALAQRGDKERVKELVTESLRDLHLATAASSARGASDEQRDRLFALCDEVRAISEPLERRRATHDWPALEEAQKLRETARELRREGEGLSDELSRQRELQREMRAHSRTDGRPRGPRLG